MDAQPIGKLVTKNGEKYFQTLYGHTLDALKILKEYIDKNLCVIEQFCERWQIDKELFLKNLFLMVYFHDIGKLTKEFQKNIRAGKHSQKYPHAFYSLYLLKEGVFEKTIMETPLEMAAILGHHTQLYNQIYMDQESIERPTFLPEEIEKFTTNAKNAYYKLGFEKYFDLGDVKIRIDKLHPKKKELKNLRNSFVRMINGYLREKEIWPPAKSIFTYIFSILQLCDDYSSANFSEYIDKYSGKQKIFDDVLDKPDKYVAVLDIKDAVKMVLGEKTPYKFQRELISASKFATLFAPCGRGKTEGALLWAVNILKNYKRNKIIFAMPTQTTSNAMHDRLAKLFGKEYVGIYHGKSFIKLREEIEKEEDTEEKDYSEIRSENFKGEVFFKPITITTIDHLIYSFVKGFPQADFATGNIQNAVIIFDEVHYYEKFTLEHLVTLFDVLRQLDIPHLLMSGTLPDFLLNRLGEEYQHITDHEGLSFRPFKFEYTKKSIFDEKVYEEIVANYKNGLTQFVILNTVERAKAFYQDLKDKFSKVAPNIMLYHSQFTYQDRAKKEIEIYERIKQKPFILVATQVIEISLDISCDIMYTELAPPDAVGQRAGRLNRMGKSWKNDGAIHILKIFSPENERPYEENVFERTTAILPKYILEDGVSYLDVKHFCDDVYTDYNLCIPTNLLSLFKESTVFGHNWKDIAFEGEEGRKFKVRDEKIQSVDVIPEVLYKKYGEDALNTENLVKIHAFYLINDIQKFGNCFYITEKRKKRKIKKYWICKYPYTYEKGIIFDEKSCGYENIIG